MRILWVKAGKLIPVDTGGKIRSYNILRHLASRHVLTLLSYYDGPKDDLYEEEIRRRFPGAVAVNTGRSISRFAQGVDYCMHIPVGRPYAVTKFTASRVRRLLAEWLNDRKFEVAVCDFLSASMNFPRALAIPVVLFQHNVESLLWNRQVQWESNWLTKIAFRFEAVKMERYERRTLSRFHHVIAVSIQDRQEMMALTDASKISVVPTGVDLERYHNWGSAVGTDPLVVFTGSMDWEANIDGIEYFCRDVWPLVRRRVPEARFRIVGRNPHDRIRKLASESIEVTGTVPSVIPHLAEAAVIVVPLRAGGGTRLKIYEAMAMGKAVVSTSIGAEGLEVVHGRDILLADDAPSFSQCVIHLLNDPKKRRQYGIAATRQVQQFDWRKVTDQFESILDKLVSSRPASPAYAVAKSGRRDSL